LTWINVADLASPHLACMFRRSLTRDVTVAVAVKAAIVIAAAIFLFGPSRIRVNALSVGAHMFYSDEKAAP
jgi:hypothetical protein